MSTDNRPLIMLLLTVAHIKHQALFVKSHTSFTQTREAQFLATLPWKRDAAGKNPPLATVDPTP